MARKELTYTCKTGRDNGKNFLITEMSARAGHAWATRMLLALMGSGAEVDEDVMSRGMAGLASIAIKALGSLNPAIVGPLTDELLDCVKIVQPAGTRKWIDDDFEEIATIFELQKAVFALHVEPFISGGQLTSESSKEAPPTA